MTKIQLPVNWQHLQLEDVSLRFVSGGTPSTKKPDYWDGDIPWTTSAPISEHDTVVEKAQRFITQSGLDNSASHIVPKRSLVVGSRVGVGKAAVNLLDIAISQDLTGIVLQEEIASPYFLAYQFKSNRIQNYFDGRKRGTTIKGVSRFDLEQLPLYLPPLEEQKAITAVLRTVQDAIAARRREAALERERKAALMQHLFMHGTRGEVLKDTAVGRIPESWQIVLLGNLCESGLGLIQTGPFGSQLHASDYQEAGIPVVNPTHLGFNTIIQDELPKVSRETADRLSRYYLLEGDILISRRGDFSRYSYIDVEKVGWLCGTGCLLIRLRNPILHNPFLAISMGAQRNQTYFQQSSVGSIMPNLNTTILKNMPIILPPLPEQIEYTRTIYACDAKITALEKENALLNELFQALLEELMSGQLRAPKDWANL
jgi:type I restriction enzyme, S subunit